MWSESPSIDWQSTQERLDAHFLQGAPWGQFQNAYGRKVFYALGEGWSWLAILEKSRSGSRLYCPYGPTANTKEALDQAIRILVQCAKSFSLTYIRVEPQGNLTEQDIRDCGLQTAHRTVQPRYTFVKDLTKSGDECLAEMSATTRNLYRTAHKKGIEFHESADPNDVAIFLKLMRQVAHRNGISIHADHYYHTMAEVLMPLGVMKVYQAKVDNVVVASNLIFNGHTTRYNVHGAADDAYRRLTPGTPLLAHIIFEAKAVGKTKFDFFGVAPPDQPNHPWVGLTKFKQSFGGNIVDMHGTWEIGVKKLHYSAYRLAAKFA